MSASNRIKVLEAGRGLAALCVVLFHVEHTLSDDKYLGYSIYSSFTAMHFGVAFFFVLSGFIITLVHRRDLGHPERIGNFVSRRFFTIYPPLWAALLVVFVMLLVAKGGEILDPWAILSAFTASPVSAGELLLMAEWTLRHEVLFYAIFAVAIFAPRLGGGLLLAWIAAPYLLGLPGDESYWRITISYYNSLFGFGIVAALIYVWGRTPVALAWSMIALGAATFGFAWYCEITYAMDPHAALLVLLYGFGSFLLVLGAVEIERRGMVRVWTPLLALGGASYSIYLINFPIIAIMARVVAPVTRKFGLPPALSFWATALVAVIAGMVFHMIVVEMIVPRIRAAISRRSVRA